METLEESPIVQRLKEFIAYSGLSSTQFADKAAIPRPTLSQMLHGRNKSVNNQMLAKLDENFPELNIMWLLFGRGDMLMPSNFKSSEPQKASSAPDIIIQGSAFQASDTGANDFDISSKSKTNEENGSSAMASEPRWHASVLCSPPDDKGETSGHRTISVDSSKRITSIIVLYSDNSFETFNPASDS